MFGAANYQGDLSDRSIILKETRPTVGVMFRYPFHETFGLRFHYIYGQLSGSDQNSKLSGNRNRGFEFQTPLHEVCLMTEIHPRKARLNNNVGMFSGGRFYPYLGIGLAVTLAPGTPKATRVTNLKPNPFPEEEDIHNFAAFPIIVGAKTYVSEHLLLSAEFGWRTVFSDYLDGISKAANPNRNDWYVLANVGVSWVFGVETCPKKW